MPGSAAEANPVGEFRPGGRCAEAGLGHRVAQREQPMGLERPLAGERPAGAGEDQQGGEHGDRDRPGGERAITAVRRRGGGRSRDHGGRGRGRSAWNAARGRARHGRRRRNGAGGYVGRGRRARGRRGGSTGASGVARGGGARGVEAVLGLGRRGLSVVVPPGAAAMALESSWRRVRGQEREEARDQCETEGEASEFAVDASPRPC